MPAWQKMVGKKLKQFSIILAECVLINSLSNRYLNLIKSSDRDTFLNLKKVPKSEISFSDCLPNKID